MRTTLGTTLLAGVALLGTALLAAACGSGDQEPEVGATSGVATPTFETSACGTCFASVCATAIDACQADAACASYLDCLLGCPLDDKGNADPTCDDGCVQTSSSEAVKLVAGVRACRFYGEGATCQECGAPQAHENQVCEPHPDPAPTPCRQCYWDKCCHTWDACYGAAADPDCDALATCMAACTDTPCRDACLAAHPESGDEFAAQIACSVSECASEQMDCDVTTRDECIACLYGTCIEPLFALLSEVEGLTMLLCYGECPQDNTTIACIEACLDAHPSVENEFLLWAECLQYKCEPLC